MLKKFKPRRQPVINRAAFRGETQHSLCRAIPVAFLNLLFRVARLGQRGLGGDRDEGVETGIQFRDLRYDYPVRRARVNLGAVVFLSPDLKVVEERFGMKSESKAFRQYAPLSGRICLF